MLRPFGRRPGRDDAEIVDFLKDAFSLKKIAPARQAAFDVINLTMLSVRHQNIWDARVCFVTEDLAHLGLMLSRFALMVQAAFLDGQFLDLFPPFDIAASRPK